jgi:glycosyltransferase involved in cell wall biosynthesis
VTVRLLVVTHLFPPYGITGVERVVEWTAEGLACRGAEVTVLTRRASAAPEVPRLEASRHRGIDVLTLVGGGIEFGVYPGRTARLEALFERVLIERNPDAVLFSHLMHHSPSYVGIAARWGVPAVIEFHDFFFACPLTHLETPNRDPCAGPDGGEACASKCFAAQSHASMRWTTRARAFAAAARDASALIAPSQQVASYFTALFRPPTLIHVVSNPVSIPVARRAGPIRIPRADGVLRLASVGSVVPHKGSDLIVDSLQIARAGPLAWDFLGPVDPAYASQLRERVQGLDCVDIRFYGPFANRTLPALLAPVDAVAIASTVPESFSIAAHEAFACGKPVIAAAAGALLEVVRDGENGLLFEPRDPYGLARVLERLVFDDGLLERLTHGAARTPVTTLDRRVDEVSAILADVVARGRRAAPPHEDAHLRAAQRWLALI